MLALTEAKRKVQLIRFPAGTIVSANSGTIEDFTLAGFIQHAWPPSEPARKRAKPP